MTTMRKFSKLVLLALGFGILAVSLASVTSNPGVLAARRPSTSPSNGAIGAGQRQCQRGEHAQCKRYEHPDGRPGGGKQRERHQPARCPEQSDPAGHTGCLSAL